jgi:hypothetical protein
MRTKISPQPAQLKTKFLSLNGDKIRSVAKAGES